MNKRVLFSDNGTLKDFSVAMDEYKGSGKAFPYTTGEDFLFIGSRLPFNHTYFKLNKVNTVDCQMTAQYWNGSEWVNFVEMNDETNGFKQSGFLTFVPNRDKPWMMSSTNYSGQIVDGLDSITIYDLYWIRISFDQTFIGPEILPVTVPSVFDDVDMQWIGNIFSNDYDLAGEYPEFVRQSVMTAFASGKTSWEEQHVIAGKVLIDDLIKKSSIDDGSQIIQKSDYTLASVHKVAEIIANAFGDDYIDQKKSSREEYSQRMNKRINRVDTNKNGREDVAERTTTTGWFGR